MTEHNEVVPEVEVPTMTPTLNISDRCERCGAQAFVITEHDGTSMFWCGHHYAFHADQILIQGGVVVLDKRDSINKAASISANV